MKYANVSLLQGELISADTADYHDYKGLLKCPECGQVVFLRKAHARNKIEIAAAFVHHKNDKDELVACDLRVNGYTKKEVEAINTGAKRQRLYLLNKYIEQMVKQSPCIKYVALQSKHLTKEGKLKYKEIETFLSLLYRDYKVKKLFLSYKDRLLEIYRTNDKSRLESFCTTVSMNKGTTKREKLEDAGFISRKNLDLANEILLFLFSSQGRKAYFSLIPDIAGFILFYYSQVFDIVIRTKSGDTSPQDDPDEYTWGQGLIALLALNIDWSEQYQKAESGSFMDWDLSGS